MGPTNTHEDPTRTTTTGFRVAWDYDQTTSRVTHWTVRYAVVGGAWTVNDIPNPNAKEHFVNPGLSYSGRKFDVEIIANSGGASSAEIGQTQVTLSKELTFSTV